MEVDYSMCFAFCQYGCLALNEKLCELGKGCSFFKTQKQLAKEQIETQNRLISLDLLKPVMRKYYK